MENNTQKRTGADLQLWEVTAPGQRQNRNSGAGYRNTGTGRRVKYRNTGTSRPVQYWNTGTSRQVQYRNTGTERPVQSINRRRAKRQRAIRNRCIAFAVFVLFLVGIFKLTGVVYRGVHAWIQTGKISTVGPDEEQDTVKTENPIEKPYITVNLLEQNRYSRPGTELKKIKNVFVHYTANKGTSAEQNRSYFANLAKSGERSASAHFIIGYEGEIIQCIPLEEEAYAVKGRNDDSVSIECCYLSDDGSFTQFTYNSLIDLLAWLCGEYGLSEQDILRHYDEGGKKCPLYYVDNEDEWEQLLEDVAEVLLCSPIS